MIKYKISCLWCFLVFLYGCSKQPEELPKQKQEIPIIRINFQNEPLSLDPRYGFDNRSQVVIKTLFEGLTRIGFDGIAHPAMAETIEISEDGKTYLFTLRDCGWTNGEPVRAIDFAHTWKSVIASQSACPLADLFYPIKNARLAKERKVSLDAVGIEVVDEKTLRVELEHPAPYFLQLVSNPLFFPVCQKTDLEDPEWNRKVEGFVCNGPFRLKQWRQEHCIEVEKNPSYYDKEVVQLAEIHINFVSDTYTSLLMFEKGEIDWMGDPFCKIPLDALPELIKKDQLAVLPYAALFWLECNTERFPLHSAKIRKALGFAIDRQSLVEHILVGQKVALSIVPETMRILDQQELFVGSDYQKARELFEEGLEELGITREEFPCLALSYSSIPGYKLIAEALQQQWKQHLGIEVTLECFEWGIYLSNFAKREYEIAPVGWVSFYHDPIYNLQVFRYKSNANNWASWENPHFQELLHQADHETETKIRAERLKEAEKMLLDEMPVIPLTYQTFKYIKNDKVKDLLITDLGEIDFKWTYIVKNP